MLVYVKLQKVRMCLLMGLNINYEIIANYIIIVGVIAIVIAIIKSILPILTYSELKKQRKLLEQINKEVSDIKNRYL